MCVGIIPQVCVVVYNYKLKIDTYLMHMPYIYIMMIVYVVTLLYNKGE